MTHSRTPVALLLAAAAMFALWAPTLAPAANAAPSAVLLAALA